MLYEINLSKIEKIANPFEQLSVQGLESPITLTEINELLEKGTFINKNETVKNKLLEDIAYCIVNFNIDIPVDINLDKPINIETGWIVENVAQYAALLYFKDCLNIQTVKANITGNPDTVKLLFNPIKEFELIENNTETTQSHYKVNTFNWKEETFNVEDNSLEAKKEKVLAENDLVTIVSLSIDKMWQDENFVKKVLAKVKSQDSDSYMFELIEMPTKYLYNSTFLNIAKEDIALFSYIWESVEKKIKTFPPFKEANNANKKVEEVMETLKENLNSQPFVESLFTNTNLSKISPYIKFIPDKVLMSQPVILKNYEFVSEEKHLLHQYTTKESLYSLFPKRYFQKAENVFKFILAMGPGLSKDASSLSYSYMFKHVIKDKETILKTLDLPFIKDNDDSNDIAYILFNAMPFELKKDVDIVKKLIDIGYVSAVDSWFEIELLDIKTIEKLFINGYKENRVPREKAFQMENQDARYAYLLHHPEAINVKEFPIEWLDEKRNLQVVAPNIIWKNLPEKHKQTILNDHNLLANIVSKNNEIFLQLPTPLKLLPKVVTSYFQSLKGNSQLPDKYWRALPKSIWINTQFSLQAIQFNINNIKNVPIECFYNKNYIIELFKIVPNYNAKELIKNLPKEITVFFTDHNVKENYVEFLEKTFFKHDLDNTLPLKTETVKKKKI